ncbi:arginyltransferase [Pseudoalteromonas luteoviolacea]|uniref:Aspartate/glutamate leucyltransferase n=1 Tax=Pseudoalteromonas luteoviolacea H33 TaxID=1365251 RepID=A0A167GTP7_9GAMM|nr:arginyltransferase [Pseudoalteromonas luteoviolacea]KZN56541.1 arginyl-tRNA-protein transferase [Pseudoalteromonas luteoviolacea H33]KZN75630.1 arginyl-tRNA-protein transferase [Pseudoalteromonas luteoviolacea H33-S]MBQ4876418.1 arginyltransferase [Pseudoalteromonas luteoviolacea]MBQ4905049.1 arginyltransferase [Pseudoalteromonas luteoviolacea]
MTEHFPSKIGLSQQFDCSYLPDRKEQLLVILDSECYTAARFEALLSLGFRRSGDQIYRPHCPLCSACQSIRVLAKDYVPSRSQLRKYKKIQNSFSVKVSFEEKESYFPLYEKYITLRHSDGTMYPPNRLQYESFLFCRWMPISFIELWHQDQLVAVAVTDTMPNALSAIYTFFDPDFEHLSLGTIMIMAQINLAAAENKEFVYLGYQIDECKKMRYKKQFSPAQQLKDDTWTNI